MDRPWFRDVLATDTAAAQLRAHVHGSRQVLDRVAEITEVLRTAAKTDPEIAELWPQDPDPRFTVLSAAAKALVAKPGAREGLSAQHAADVLFGLISPELYLLLVRDNPGRRPCARARGRSSGRSTGASRLRPANLCPPITFQGVSSCIERAKTLNIA